MDDRLRALQRETRARPDDRAAAWTYVRALEQAGDASGRWRELCRIARSGDDDAWRELELPPAGPRRVEVTARRDHEGPLWPGEGTSQGLLALGCRAGVEVVDARTLEKAWGALAEGLSAVVSGPHVTHVADDRRAVVVRQLATGDEVARVPVEHVTNIQASADRLVAFCGSAVEVIDVGERPGDLVWRGSTPFGNVARDLVVASEYHRGRDEALTAWAWGATSPRWSAAGSLQNVDARDVILVSFVDGACSFSGVATETGVTRWTRPMPADASTGATLAPDRVVLTSSEGLVAIDRGSGDVRWRLPLGAEDLLAVSAGSDVIYVLYRLRPAPRKYRVVLAAFEALDGAVRGECVVLERNVRDARLAPVPGGVVVVANLGRDEVRLMRVGDP